MAKRISLCVECRGTYETDSRTDFCSNACKAKFHNRRAKRGALVYDAEALMRAEPEKAATIRQRLELQWDTWRREDEAAGRLRTTRRLSDVMIDLPFYERMR